ncbi:MAG: hypothetical protein NT119_02485 [Actinobacteria bacterium]|nr:hypothetical protein [Actinomycetota bacterium]
MNKSLKLSGQIFASLLLLTFFGCGADSQLSNSPTTSPSSSPSTDLTASTDQTVAGALTETPAYFTAQLVGGEKFSSAELLKTQPLAFWFWAPG